jgi:glucose-6-phosphate 1-dehydrogenase
LVLFGATGDLTKRLVAPALYNLASSGALPENFALIGVARSDLASERWRKDLHEAMEGFTKAGGTFHVDRIDEKVWQSLAERMTYVQGDLTDQDLYTRVGEALETAAKAWSTRGNVIFYFAIADTLIKTVVEGLGKARLTEEKEGGGWRRVVVEKPFGHDLKSATALDAEILKVLKEDQVYRIDHFLGKDTVQSVLAFRFANGLFEPIWNRDRIDHVQITAAETVGVEQRADFYEQTGALRDMIPNHLLSLLCLVAMEPPTCFDAAAIREKKVDVLTAIPAVQPERAVRGQYGNGHLAGKAAKAYRSEPGVAADSPAETYAALEVEIDNWRWAGVPFYLRTGKHLASRVTEIAIRFKQAPYSAFQDTPVETLRPNWLVMRVAPDEGISLQFEVKRRGPLVDLAAVRMDFRYNDWFPPQPNVGYETLIYDVMIGDPTLFMRADMVEQTWRIVQPVIDAWAAEKPAFPNYDSGAEGPRAAEELISRGGERTWRPLEDPAEHRQ